MICRNRMIEGLDIRNRPGMMLIKCVMAGIFLWTPQVSAELSVVTVKVIDETGQTVAGAQLYKGSSLVFDNKQNRWHISEDAKSMGQSSSDGILQFELPANKHERIYLVADESLKKIACLNLLNANLGDTHTLTLCRPAHIRAELKIENTSIAHNKIMLLVPFEDQNGEKKTVPFMKGIYELDTPADSIPVDILCPSGGPFRLIMQSKGVRRYFIKEIPPLLPGSIHDLGEIVLDPFSVGQLIGRKAPPLTIAQWVKGNPVTVNQLIGKVVLLDFWGYTCPPCIKQFPELIELHNKYASDGLVIIAIHDSSKDKKAVLNDKQSHVLDDIPFRIAVDTPVSRSSGKQEPAEGYGKTIESYGVCWFPTLVLLSKQGQVQGIGHSNLESRIQVLLYGSTEITKSPIFWVKRLLGPGTMLSVLVLGVVLLLLLANMVRKHSRDRKA